jgi:hypothetical protein
MSQIRQPEESEAPTGFTGERRATPPGLFESGQHFARTTRLACEGALSLLLSTSVRGAWVKLVRAGLEWEDEYTRLPERRRPDQPDRM